MSFILDALRRSEQERQIAAGRGAGLLYPMIVERNPKSRLRPLLLAAVLCAMVAAGMAWWLRPGPSLVENAVPIVQKDSGPGVANPVAPTPQRVQPSVMPLPAAASIVQKDSGPGVANPVASTPQRVQPSVMPLPAAASREANSKSANTAASTTANTSANGAPPRSADIAEPSAKKRRAPTKEVATRTPPSVASSPGPAAPPGDEPKGLPALSITGYINDQDGTRLVIVNDRLLREGDEVSPGLRLEKIEDDAALFSYKGQRFRR